jgi:NAD(P)-dependent dehydrogenase (short-subunit alcohol dehydrogenase family)
MTMNSPAASSAWRDYRPTATDFTDRVVMVTGATAGIGRAVARELVRAGATVILHGRNEKALEAAYQELKPLGPEPSVAHLDLERAQGPEYQALTAAIESRYGRLDGLLHNAAILGDRSPIEHYDIGLWQRVLLVDLTAPFILTRCMLPLLRNSADASVVFTTSGVGRRGRAYWGAYAAAKAGTERLAEVLADELENTPIRVNLINPGRTRTRMRARAYPAENPASVPAPDSAAPAYLYLLGAASRDVRGQRFEVQEPSAAPP